MKSTSAIFIKLVLVQTLAIACVSQSYDFFYLVQQWPGSFCDTEQSCCYPTTGKPDTNFGIHGFWPNNNDGSYPSNCDPDNPFDKSKISDLINRMETSWPSLACPSSDGTAFWKHEWEKHGTCSESVLGEHEYFQAALNLKDSVDLLQVLQSAGVNPDGGSYSLSSISGAIKGATGYAPGIECNVDASGNSQLYQIYLCVDTSGSKFIECPVLPSGGCASSIEFTSF